MASSIRHLLRNMLYLRGRSDARSYRRCRHWERTISRRAFGDSRVRIMSIDNQPLP
jgi:hypothetical protein